MRNGPAMALTTSIILALLAALLLTILSCLIRDARLLKQMPPGPAGLPILGNIFQLTQPGWLRFTEWKDRYGEYDFLYVSTDRV